MTFLHERVADPSGSVHLGLTGLHLSVITQRLDVARWLVEHGADLEARDGIHNGTPLGWAEHTAPGSAIHDWLRNLV